MNRNCYTKYTRMLYKSQDLQLSENRNGIKPCGDVYHVVQMNAKGVGIVR